MFDLQTTLMHLETLRRPNGAFIAAHSYPAFWLRDHLYMTMAYYYLYMHIQQRDEYVKKLQESIGVAFNVFHAQRHKLERVRHPQDTSGNLIVHELIHAKYDPNTLHMMTNDWGHHQLDAIGLFLYLVADLDYKNIPIIRDNGDRTILQLLVFYLENVRYWEKPDNGMWEICWIRKSSSIGAVCAGLYYLERRGLATVPNELITLGENQLQRILPYESRDHCEYPGHGHDSHDCDAAQLFLIWPFNIINRQMADTIINRIVEGHPTEYGTFHRLVQENGINRFWGDNYMQSDNGISAEWQWEYLVSIIFSQRHQYEQAILWLRKSARRITPEGYITEAFRNGKPNENTPLGWMLALAIIAYCKLPPEFREQINQ